MKTSKIATVSLLLLFFVLSVWAAGQQKPMDEWEALQVSLQGTQSIHPKNGFVPDEPTAIQIAEAAVKAQYGEKTVVVMNAQGKVITTWTNGSGWSTLRRSQNL